MLWFTSRRRNKAGKKQEIEDKTICNGSIDINNSWKSASMKRQIDEPHNPLDLESYKLLLPIDKQHEFVQEVTELYDCVRSLRRKRYEYRDLIDTIAQKEIELKQVVDEMCVLRAKVSQQRRVCTDIISVRELSK